MPYLTSYLQYLITQMPYLTSYLLYLRSSPALPKQPAYSTQPITRSTCQIFINNKQ